MELEWDQAKDQHNIEKHGIGFEAVRGFDWESALIYRNDRKREHRWVAVGYIGSRLHRIAYADRGNARRIISLFKANARERKRYERRT